MEALGDELGVGNRQRKKQQLSSKRRPKRPRDWKGIKAKRKISSRSQRIRRGMTMGDVYNDLYVYLYINIGIFDIISSFVPIWFQVQACYDSVFMYIFAQPCSC